MPLQLTFILCIVYYIAREYKDNDICIEWERVSNSGDKKYLGAIRLKYGEAAPDPDDLYNCGRIWTVESFANKYSPGQVCHTSYSLLI